MVNGWCFKIHDLKFRAYGLDMWGRDVSGDKWRGRRARNPTNKTQTLAIPPRPSSFHSHGRFSKPQKALRRGIPDPYLEPLTRTWSHFVGIYRQKLTNSSGNDFWLRVPRALRGHSGFRVRSLELQLWVGFRVEGAYLGAIEEGVLGRNFSCKHK